jgi:hypothetical protein
MQAVVVDQKSAKPPYKVQLPENEVAEIKKVNDADAKSDAVIAEIKRLFDFYTECKGNYERYEKEYRNSGNKYGIYLEKDQEDEVKKLKEIRTPKVDVAIRLHRVLASISIQGEPQYTMSRSSQNKKYISAYTDENIEIANWRLIKMREVNLLAAIDSYAEIKATEGDLKELAIEQLKAIANPKPQAFSFFGATKSDDIAPLLAFSALCRMGSADAKKDGAQITDQAGSLPIVFNGVRALYGIGREANTLEALTCFNNAVGQGSVLAAIYRLELCLDSKQKILAETQQKYCVDAIAVMLKAHRAKASRVYAGNESDKKERHDREEEYLLKRVTDLITKVRSKLAQPTALSASVAKPAAQSSDPVLENINVLLEAGLNTPWTRFLRLAIPQLLTVQPPSPELYACLSEYAALHETDYPEFALAGLKLLHHLQGNLHPRAITLPPYMFDCYNKYKGKAHDQFAYNCINEACDMQHIPALLERLDYWRKKIAGIVNSPELPQFLRSCRQVHDAIKTQPAEVIHYRKNIESIQQELIKIQELGILESAKQAELVALIENFKNLLSPPKVLSATAALPPSAARSDAKVLDSKMEVVDELAKARLALQALADIQKKILELQQQAQTTENRFFDSAKKALQQGKPTALAELENYFNQYCLIARESVSTTDAKADQAQRIKFDHTAQVQIIKNILTKFINSSGTSELVGDAKKLLNRIEIIEKNSHSILQQQQIAGVSSVPLLQPQPSAPSASTVTSVTQFFPLAPLPLSNANAAAASAATSTAAVTAVTPSVSAASGPAPSAPQLFAPAASLPPPPASVPQLMP